MGAYVWPIRNIIGSCPYFSQLPSKHVEKLGTIRRGKPTQFIVCKVEDLVEEASARAHHEAGLIKACNTSSRNRGLTIGEMCACIGELVDILI